MQFTRNIAINEGTLRNQHFAFLTITSEFVILYLFIGVNSSLFNEMLRGKALNNYTYTADFSANRVMDDA